MKFRLKIFQEFLLYLLISFFIFGEINNLEELSSNFDNQILNFFPESWQGFAIKEDFQGKNIAAFRSNIEVSSKLYQGYIFAVNLIWNKENLETSSSAQRMYTWAISDSDFENEWLHFSSVENYISFLRMSSKVKVHCSELNDNSFLTMVSSSSQFLNERANEWNLRMIRSIDEKIYIVGFPMTSETEYFQLIVETILENQIVSTSAVFNSPNLDNFEPPYQFYAYESHTNSNQFIFFVISGSICRKYIKEVGEFNVNKIEYSKELQIPPLGETPIFDQGEYAFFVGLDSKFYIFSRDLSKKLYEESSYSYSSRYKILTKQNYILIGIEDSSKIQIHILLFSNIESIGLIHSQHYATKNQDSEGFLLLDDPDNSIHSILYIPDLPDSIALNSFTICDISSYYDENLGECVKCPEAYINYDFQSSCSSICNSEMNNLQLCTNLQCSLPLWASWGNESGDELNCIWKCNQGYKKNLEENQCVCDESYHNYPENSSSADISDCSLWVCNSGYFVSEGVCLQLLEEELRHHNSKGKKYIYLWLLLIPGLAALAIFGYCIVRIMRKRLSTIPRIRFPSMSPSSASLNTQPDLTSRANQNKAKHFSPGFSTEGSRYFKSNSSPSKKEEIIKVESVDNEQNHSK